MRPPWALIMGGHQPVPAKTTVTFLQATKLVYQALLSDYMRSNRFWLQQSLENVPRVRISCWIYNWRIYFLPLPRGLPRPRPFGAGALSLAPTGADSFTACPLPFFAGGASSVECPFFAATPLPRPRPRAAPLPRPAIQMQPEIIFLCTYIRVLPNKEGIHSCYAKSTLLTLVGFVAFLFNL